MEEVLVYNIGDHLENFIFLLVRMGKIRVVFIHGLLLFCGSISKKVGIQYGRDKLTKKTGLPCIELTLLFN